MEHEGFYNDKRFLRLKSDIQELINDLIQKFKVQGFTYDLKWRDYSSNKKQFSIKNNDNNYEIDVLATATVLTQKKQVNIEVHGGEFHVKNQFIFNNEATACQIERLFEDIKKLMNEHKYGVNM